VTVTFRVQQTPSASVVPQLSLSAYSPVPLAVPIVRGAEPVFETVTVCAWLAVPPERLPKESVEGEAVMPGNVPCPPAVASVDTCPEVSLATG